MNDYLVLAGSCHHDLLVLEFETLVEAREEAERLDGIVLGPDDKILEDYTGDPVLAKWRNRKAGCK